MTIDISSINTLSHKLSMLCHEPVASSIEEVNIWEESPEKRLNAYRVSPLPKELYQDIETAKQAWIQIENLFMLGMKNILNQSKNEFLDTFEKTRKAVIDEQIDSDLNMTIRLYGNRVEEVIWNISWIDMFSCFLPKADPSNSNEYIAIGKTMVAIMYFEILNKSIQKNKGKVLHTDIINIEARYKLCNMLSTSSNKVVKFQRNFLPHKLTNESIFNNELKNDCINENVFMAIRNGYVDFYHKGGRLFKYDNKGFQTHLKYAAAIMKKRNDYLTEAELSTHTLATNFAANYNRIKENCSKYAGIEAIGVSSLYHKYSYLSNHDIVLLDIEVSFQSCDNEKKQDRIDLLIYNKATQTLRFVEAKHYSNPEIRSRTTPAIVSQINRYKKQINANKDRIIAEYGKYIGIINLIFGKSLPIPTELSEDVSLLIFGFDNDQKKGELKTIESHLKAASINYYLIGDMKNIDTKNLK